MNQKVAMVGTPCEIMAASKIQHYTESVIDFKIGDYRVGQGFGNQHTERFEKAVDNTAQIERSVFGSPRIYLCNGLEITALPDT